jgi:hypothetical protein
MPGAEAAEVERQVSTRLEKLLYQIPGVEYVYSTSMPGQAVVTVRFYVGQDLERSWVKLHNKIQANVDQVPPGVTGWVVKPVEIDDVPIVSLTLYSPTYSDYELRRMAEELEIACGRQEHRSDICGGRTASPDHGQLSPGDGRAAWSRRHQRALTGNIAVPAGELTQSRFQAGQFSPGRRWESSWRRPQTRSISSKSPRSGRSAGRDVPI